MNVFRQQLLEQKYPRHGMPAHVVFCVCSEAITRDLAFTQQVNRHRNGKRGENGDGKNRHLANQNTQEKQNACAQLKEGQQAGVPVR